MSGLEFWATMGVVKPGEIMATARRAEADGWDGFKIFDTQCLVGEAFVFATAAAAATSRISLSFSASNPATRHPSVAASAMAALAEIADRPIYFGVGRGDSALAYVGGAPASLELFERYIKAVRAYLRGEPVPFDEIKPWRLTADVSTVKLSHAPEHSSLTWIDRAKPPAQMEVYATGPKAIGVAGRCADRIALGLGADVARLRWAMEIAREARAEAGLDPKTLSFTAVVPTCVGEDQARARHAVSNLVASSARFSVISGALVGPATPAQRAVYEAVGQRYDMNQHGGHGDQVNALTDEFIDSYAIVGPPSACLDRIHELAEIGIDAIMLGAPPVADTPTDLRKSYELLVEQVLPQARSELR
jgi:5,10-methylenetetrahydromethanopterin reductase